MTWRPGWAIGMAAGVLGLGALGLSYWAVRPQPIAAPAPAAVAPSGSTQALAAIAQAVAQERWGEARRLCQQLLQEHPDSPDAAQAQQQLGEINVHLLFTPGATSDTPFYTTYTIEPGDTLGRIARQHTTTIELLQKANHLTGDMILVGHTLKVPVVTFSVVVDKSQNTLTLKANEEVLKTYTVSTGKDNQTPVGTFTIVNKLVDPPWYTAQGVIPPGSPENILGSRWLGFSKPGYGIHGTTDPSTIGQPVTAGCVRLRNPEVEELYALLPLGTDVTIVD